MGYLLYQERSRPGRFSGVDLSPCTQYDILETSKSLRSNDIKKFITGCAVDPIDVPHLVQIRPREDLWAKCETQPKFYALLGSSTTCQTHRRIFMLDGMMAQTTRTHACVGYVFLDVVNITPNEATSFQIHQFWGANRHFQAKRAKY